MACLLLSTIVPIVLAWTTPSPLSRSTRRSSPYTPSSPRNEARQSLVVLNVNSKDRYRKTKDELMDFINLPVSGDAVGDADGVSAQIWDDELAPVVKEIVMAADGRKAQDIVALRVSKCTSLTSFVLILCGNSRPQNQAIAASIRDSMKEAFVTTDGKETYSLRGNGVPEGSADSGWILLDYGDIMVHIMTPKSRLFYDMEGQWRDKGGESMDLEHLLVPNTVPSSSATPGADSATPVLGGGMANLSEEDDPFWS